jgi:hypothetical protein
MESRSVYEMAELLQGNLTSVVVSVELSLLAVVV